MKKLLLLGVVVAFLALGSCSDDYDERFDKLEQQLQNVISQVEGASELSAAISALEAQITTLKNAVGELPNGDALSGGLASLEAEIATLETELADLAETGATSEELATLVAGLTSDLDLLKGDLSELLENSNVLTGDLVIFDQNSLGAALSLGDRVAIVNGRVQIIADGLAAVDLNVVTSKIVAITASMNVQTDKELDFSNLETVGDVLAVVGNKVDLSGLKSVGDDLKISWDGDYDFPGLTLVGDEISLGTAADEEASTPRIINFLNVKASEITRWSGAEMDLSNGVYGMESNSNSISKLYFPNATSVVLGDVPVYELYAGIAENIELHYEGELDDDLRVVSSASSITVKASAMVDGSDIAIYALGDTDTYDEYIGDLWNYNFSTNTDYFTIPTTWNSQINLPNMAAFNDDEDIFLVSQTLTAPLLEGYVDDLFLTQENVTLPNISTGYFYTIGNVNVELASIDEINAQDYADLESLKLTAMENDLDGDNDGELDDEDKDWVNLTSLTIIGYTPDSLLDAITIKINDDEDAFDALETLELGGLINMARVHDLDVFTTLTTSGNINELYIYDNSTLVNLTLGHEHISGLNGAELIVERNLALESLVTEKLDFLKYVGIEDNPSLASIDLSSWKTLLVDFDGNGNNNQVLIYIKDNDISGERTLYVPESGTTSAQPELVKSAELYSLKNIMDALEAYASANDFESIKDFGDQFYVEFKIDNVDITTTETVEDAPLYGESDDCFEYTWTDTQDIISIVPSDDCF